MKKYILLALFAIMFLLFQNSYGQENLIFTVNGVTFNMIFVEGGSFVMGCTSEQGNCYQGERPTHKVTLTDFFMGELQVTQKLWQAVMGSNLQQQWVAKYNGYLDDILARLERTPEEYSKTISLNGVGDNYPIYFINYSDCEQFCNRLNQLLADQLPEGYKFRIPTEAQWEYAARGGKNGKGYTFSGSDNIEEVAWYDTNSKGITHEVGKKIKNELGIYDMSGNVWEWCRDRYSENYYSNSLSVNPKGPDKGTQYVLRGGSWNQNIWACRTATRLKDEATAYTTNYGFRLSLEPYRELANSEFFGNTNNFTLSQISSGKNLTFKTNDIEFEMVFVEGGHFLMGCNSEQNKDDFKIFICDSIEKPAHKVKLSNYYMSKLEVTQKLWHAVMETTVQQQRDLVNTNWGIYSEGDNYPMYYVNYEDCEAFCEKLNRLLADQLPEGYRFTLPTEAQWEYAARGGKKSKGYTFSGSNFINKVAWWEENSEKKLHEVGLKFSNELGIYDMSGNVWEWCRDWFEDTYYSYGSTTNPQGPLSGIRRVLRGGSWDRKTWHSRVTTRYYYEPAGCSANVGFRIALEPKTAIFDLKSLKNAASKLSSQFISAKNRNFKIADLYFEMVFVEGRTFTMGCTSDPNDCFGNEEPIHSVTLSDFYVGKFQVTQELWYAVMGTTLRHQCDLANINLPVYNKDDNHPKINYKEVYSKFDRSSFQHLPERDNEMPLYGEGNYYPMYYISYIECEEFCEKLNQLLSKQLPEGYKFCLPTEAQWEYAARGGKKSKGYTYSGGDNIEKLAFYEENSNDQTCEVGTKKANELGIYDMSGNVWEWCLDWFDSEYYNYSPFTDPAGPGYGYHRVLRGGSWRSIPQGCRVSCRFKSSPNERASNCGLRLALVAVSGER
jgi:formylglycine-generating enzyme required for sulfatase activity